MAALRPEQLAAIGAFMWTFLSSVPKAP